MKVGVSKVCKCVRLCVCVAAHEQRAGPSGLTLYSLRLLPCLQLSKGTPLLCIMTRMHLAEGHAAMMGGDAAVDLPFFDNARGAELAGQGGDNLPFFAGDDALPMFEDGSQDGLPLHSESGAPDRGDAGEAAGAESLNCGGARDHESVLKSGQTGPELPGSSNGSEPGQVTNPSSANVTANGGMQSGADKGEASPKLSGEHEETNGRESPSADGNQDRETESRKTSGHMNQIPGGKPTVCDTVGDERNGGKNENAEMRNCDDETRDVP